MAFNAKGGEPAEPTAERHPQCDPSKNLTIDIKQSVLTDGVKATAKGGEPAPVRVSETGRARNWTMPPLRLERECKERPNSATIDNRCVEFDRRESTESTAIIGLRALGRRIAFTMAEILLSLTIIGVVAAITLPSLTGNINERTWNTQRKALYARFSQAIALMPSLNGYGTLTEESSSGAGDAVDTAAETFVTAGLAKVLKINNICDSGHFEDCGITSKVIDLNGSVAFSSFPNTLVGYNNMFSGSFSFDGSSCFVYHQVDTKAAAFETANGESIVVYYNPNCQSNMNETGIHYTQPKMCANFIYDLNGIKGPNTVGKDIGAITALYASDPVVVAPLPIISKDKHFYGTHAEAVSKCKELNDETRIPTKEELASVFYNRRLFGINAGNSTWTGSRTAVGANRAWLLQMYAGQLWTNSRTYSAGVQCIKR